MSSECPHAVKAKSVKSRKMDLFLSCFGAAKRRQKRKETKRKAEKGETKKETRKSSVVGLQFASDDRCDGGGGGGVCAAGAGGRGDA